MTVAELKAAQADAPDGVGQVPHGIPHDYNFAADVLQKNLTAGAPARAAERECYCPVEVALLKGQSIARSARRRRRR